MVEVHTLHRDKGEDLLESRFEDGILFLRDFDKFLSLLIHFEKRESKVKYSPSLKKMTHSVKDNYFTFLFLLFGECFYEAG